MKLVTTLATLLLSLAAVSAAHAGGDATRGETVFKHCKACHTIEEGGSPKIGGNLFGVYGRQAGTAPPGSAHSAELEESGIVWDEETLTAWLKEPARFVQGTKMSFRLADDQDIDDVIAYLEANSPEAE